MDTHERGLKAGHPAPDFELKDQNGKDFISGNLRNKRLLLSFHPLAWTEVCSQQMQSLEKNFDVFESLNTVPVGLSVDSVPCKKAWAGSLDIQKTQLLSDFWPHGEVARMFDIFREKNGFSERANIIIDEKGIIAFFKSYPLSQLPDIGEIIDFIRQMK
ncbi:MAG: redoxin domain-containing protein [Dehalococcoidia bacterium]|nr:redoxin domain-containing protein [Dehalococcoidia bacterium]